METASVNKYKLIAFTDNGVRLMERLAEALKAEDAGDKSEESLISASDNTEETGCACKRAVNVAEIPEVVSVSAFASQNFVKGNVLVFIGAAAIAVRAIAPFIKDKTTDPAVIVIDEKGKFVIPILSGHIGGANAEAGKIAGILGVTPVITTATDINGEFAVDIFAAENDLAISDMKLAKEFAAKLLRTGEAYYYIDEKYSDYIHVLNLPDNIRQIQKDKYRVAQTVSDNGIFEVSPEEKSPDFLRLVPKCIVVGMGCKKGKSHEELRSFLHKNIRSMKLDPKAICAIVTADIKREEAGLQELAKEVRVPFVTFGADELEAQKGDFSGSEFVKSITGVDNICERAVMAYGAKRLIMRKVAESGMTIAIGAIEITIKY